MKMDKIKTQGQNGVTTQRSSPYSTDNSLVAIYMTPGDPMGRLFPIWEKWG